MRGSLSFVSFVVLVNGNAKRWVKASRELRQGDPLSPFLFTIIVDVLSRLMLRAVESGLLEGFGVGRSGTTISHLQFTDATIFFSRVSLKELETRKIILVVFGHIYGLKVNLEKSTLFGINVDLDQLDRMALVLDCKVLECLFLTWDFHWGISKAGVF